MIQKTLIQFTESVLKQVRKWNEVSAKSFLDQMNFGKGNERVKNSIAH